MTNTAIIILEGDRGCGKTIGLASYSYLNYAAGYNLVSNITLKPPMIYTPIFKVNNLLDLPEDIDNWLVLDELWKMGADSRRSMESQSLAVSAAVLESRKRHAHLGISTQFIDQVDLRITRLANMRIRPKCIFDEWGRPILLVGEYDLGPRHPKSKPYIMPLGLGGYYIPDLYDTHEIVSGMDKDIEALQDEIIERYEGFGGKAGDLSSIIMIEENRRLKSEGRRQLKSGEASAIARYVIASKNRE